MALIEIFLREYGNILVNADSQRTVGDFLCFFDRYEREVRRPTGFLRRFLTGEREVVTTEIYSVLVGSAAKSDVIFSRIVAASGIEAPSGGETGTGSTVGESPAPEGGDVQ